MSTMLLGVSVLFVTMSFLHRERRRSSETIASQPRTHKTGMGDTNELRNIGLAGAAALLMSATSAMAAGELHIYNWGDYTNPELIEKFEKDTGIKVTLDSYDSNETMLAKVRAGGTGYDIVVPSTTPSRS